MSSSELCHAADTANSSALRSAEVLRLVGELLAAVGVDSLPKGFAKAFQTGNLPGRPLLRGRGGMTVARLCRLYLEHAKVYYARPAIGHDRPSTTVGEAKH